MKAFLVLEDGTVFEGTPFGACGDCAGTVVFITETVGYEGILTDPASKGQVIVMTYPLIGNYGVNYEDLESDTCHCAALVVRENSRIRSNFRADEDLDEFLKRNGVTGIAGVDTRALTLHIRENGEMRGSITCRSQDMTDEDIKNIVSEVRSYKSNLSKYDALRLKFNTDDSKEDAQRIAIIDLGVRSSSLRQLELLGFQGSIVPIGTSASEILKMNPDGIFISSGPEELELIDKVAEELKHIIGKVPIFGVGTGNLVLGRSLGASVRKMRFGHRGSNYSVRNLETGKLDITLQYHRYVLDEETLQEHGVTISHKNLVDGTVEGISIKDKKAFAIQYIPIIMEVGSVSEEFVKFKEILK